MKHYETIICPKCKAVEVAEVNHIQWKYMYVCSKCGTTITKDSWKSTGHLHNTNMESVLGIMKSNSVDIVITDPPYGVRMKEEWDNQNNFIRLVNYWLTECLRVTRHTVIWFCAGKMMPYILKNREHLFHRLHTWEKPAGTQFAGASHNNIWYSIEPILVFSKDIKETISYGKEERYAYDSFRYGTIAKKVWNHPTVKPVDLMAELILHYSKEGETVLDPFGGSGSTAEACIKSGRNFIIIERDEAHFNTILKRISDINNQINLF